MMKENAVIVCTARGNIIDEDDLYDALKSGRIGGAGLDVFAQEPLPTDSRLFELENCILTPHVSSQTYESLWNIYKKAIDIMDAFYKGEPLGRGDLVNPDYVH
jgi:phosphoglycerate dehydrogenase-like enzyme